MAAETNKPELVIRRLGTNEEVRRVKLDSTSTRYVELVMLGMFRNMDTDKFYIDDSEVPTC